MKYIFQQNLNDSFYDNYYYDNMVDDMLFGKALLAKHVNK